MSLRKPEDTELENPALVVCPDIAEMRLSAAVICELLCSFERLNWDPVESPLPPKLKPPIVSDPILPWESCVHEPKAVLKELMDGSVAFNEVSWEFALVLFQLELP